jgi:signal transduction histidine kinase
VLQQALGLWALAFGTVLGGVVLLPIALMLAVMPVVLAVPFVSRAVLLKMGVVAMLIAVVGVAVLLSTPVFRLGLPEEVVRIAIGIGQFVLAAFCCLSVWFSRFMLAEASGAIEAANHELLRSEERLEHKVEARTAELSRSQQALRLARDRALAANRHKSIFLANMSHELRTPLNAIIGFSEVLGERIFGELTDKQAEYVRDVYESAQHLLGLINAILDLSKIEAGYFELSRKPVALAAVLDGALARVREPAAQRSIALAGRWDADLGALVADERRLRDVLDNLLENALKYTPAEGRVVLGARALADDVEITVSDSGIGIKADDQASIFEAFGHNHEEGEGATAAAHGGVRLGLALTRKLVELHGGQISLESTVGHGSTFRVCLPRGTLGGGTG